MLLFSSVYSAKEGGGSRNGMFCKVVGLRVKQSVYIDCFARVQSLKYISLLFSFFAFTTWGQNETSKWHFGTLAGLNFSTNPPSILTNGALISTEGCASIADAAGNLLFYTNSITIFDASHTTMANGFGLIGSTSTSQAAIIIKRPSSLTNYFVFHLTTALGGLYHSEVNMSLAAGAGSVVAKNVFIASNLGEQMCAVRHANGLDYWLMLHELGTSVFRAYLVSSTGVSAAAVTSTVGSTFPNFTAGCMKFSPNGAKLGIALTTSLVEVFDFNASTGIVSNAITLGGAPTIPYGAEFSPDGTKFYCKGTNSLVQWNLCAASPSLVAASAISFTATTNSLGSLQLAQNGKIYAALFGAQALGVINSPNLAGTACNYVDQGQSIAPRFSSAGLPNFVSSWFKPALAPFTFTVSNAFGCQTASFSVPASISTLSATACAFSGYSITGLQWNFGDPSSGAANTTTINSPGHYFTSTGTYTVQLVVSYSSGGSNDTLRQVVNITQPCPFTTSSGISCATLGSATVSIGGGALPFSYTWMPTAQVGSVATNLYPGTYTVTCFDITNNNSFTIATTFTSAQAYSATVLSTSVLACNGINNGTASAIVTGGSASQNYFWSNGTYTQTAATATALGIGIHSVTIADALTFCSSSHTFVITQPPPLTGTISAASPTACAGSSVQLSLQAAGGTGAYSYTWSLGGAGSTAIATQTVGGLFSYTAIVADSNNCVNTKTIGLTFIPNPLVSVNTPTICAGQSTTLVAGGASNYTWMPGANSSSTLSLTPASTVIYTISGEALGCTSEVTTTVTLLPVPSLSFATFSITCASLGSATVFAGGAVGPYSYTWAPVQQTNSVATNLTPGSYTLIVLDAGTGCTSVGTTTFTSLIPLNGDLINTSSITCFGAGTGTAAIQNITGGSANQNYAWSNGIVTYTNPSPSNLSAGNWSINLTDALTGCLVYSVFTITQPLPFTFSIGANSASVCANDLISFTANVSGGTLPYTYSWTGGAAVNTASYSTANAGVFSSTLLVNDFYQCQASAIATIDVVQNPTVSVASVSICPLQIGTLTASGASTYSWYANTFSTSGSSFTDSPQSSTMYNIVGAALGCTATSTGSITVYPLPNAQTQITSPRCQGLTAFLSATGGSAYQWQGPQTFTSTLNSITLSNLLVSQTGIYNVTVTSLNGCTATAGANLVVNPTPTISAFASTVCSSQVLSLTANSFTGATYIWVGPQNFLSFVQNPTIANPGLNKSGNYVVIVSSVNGCTNMASAAALVVAPPSVNLALSNPSLCSQSFNNSKNTVTLSAAGANTYTIFTPAQFGSTAITGAAATLVPQAPFSSSLSVGTITVEGSNGICSAFATVTVTVKPNPVISLNTTTPTICAGQSFTFNALGASSYVWTGSSNNYTPFAAGSVVIASPKSNDLFSVFGSSVGCNSSTQTSTVTVLALPSFSLSASSNSICMFENTNLTVIGNASTYSWLPAPGITVYTGTSVVASPTIFQTYTVIGSANSCTNTGSITVGVWPLPQPSTQAYSPKVCTGTEVKLSSFGGVSYLWNGPSNFFASGQQISFIALSPALSGVYSVTVIDTNACEATTTAVVEVLSLPEGGLKNVSEEFCAPICTDFYFAGPDASRNYSAVWEINNQTFSGAAFRYCFVNAGTYTLSGKYTDRQTGCSNTVSYKLVARPNPTANFEYAPQQPIEGGEEVVFTNASKGERLSNFNWYFNENNEYSSASKDARYYYAQPGNYRVALVVKNEWQCADTVVKSVNVLPDFSIYVPNSFTPNDDNLNDVFLPKLKSAKLYSLRIYDRWGQEVFYSVDPETGWDGTFRASSCKQDVYQWKIELSTVNGEKKILNGSLTLLR